MGWFVSLRCEFECRTKLNYYMMRFYYVIQTLLHGRNANVIKIVSLGLGLMMSILLFSRVAYEQSFDTCFKEYQHLYQVWSEVSIGNKTYPPSSTNVGKMAAGILEAMPDVVESATSTGTWMVSSPLYNGNVCFKEEKVAADSLFFQTMGIEVLSGNPVKDLQQMDVIFLSERLAKRMFDDENPIGKVISFNKEINLTVRGTYATIPYNSTMNPEAVISMPSIWKRNIGNYSWEGGDSWGIYLRLKPDTDVEAMNKRIRQMVKQHLPEGGLYSLESYAKPIRDTYRGLDNVKRMTLIMSILGASILFITALNYALLSISSLSRRAKAVGVHKCSGAEKGTIFGMFLCETAIIILLALMLMGFLIFNFRDFVEDTASAKLASLFAFDRIWVPLTVTLILFLIGGVLPGQLFSSIPVTQVFKRYTEGKKGWKRSLLFIQFSGVAFVGGLMAIIFLQYQFVINKDTGYNPERIAIGQNDARDYEGTMAAKHFYESLPYVEAVTSSVYNPTDGYSGQFVYDETGKSLFSTKWDYVSENYVSFMGMAIKQGRTPRQSRELAVNETWLKMRRWSADEAIGQTIQTEEGRVKIVGVIKDFHIGSFFEEQLPFVMHHYPTFGNTVYVKLKEPFTENLQKLNKEASEVFHKEIEFRSMETMMAENYNSVRVFRNATIVATFVILFITLMGLIGYTNDETQRRSKEIAIRKVNGAEASNILELLTKDVLCTALPAVLLGTMASWYVGEIWISQFSTTLGSTIPYYLTTALATLLMIVAIVVLKTWHIANENPVVSIKSE